ncbi:MAG: L-2-hydroxyglutarate oxidase [Planctomycetaceae bacterium]
MRPPRIFVVGGGIVGLATAYQVQQAHPDFDVQVLEKESSVASHQTGRNSGVLHSGIYYKPGTMKARNCREGKVAMETFCQENGIPFDRCGKVIVAVSPDEIPAMENILARGQANGVACERIGPERLKELEPHAAGVAALHVPETGIVDYLAVSEKLAELIRNQGGQIHFQEKVLSIRTLGNEKILQTTKQEWPADYVINCGGLFSDRVARSAGMSPPAKIVPFRGEYFELSPEYHHLCKNLIYPVPDPNFSFLGVHFTRMMRGGVECGPNAVFAFAREGYSKWDVNIFDLADSLTYSGFLRLAFKYWPMGAGEMWRSFSKRAFVKALQRLMPEIREEYLVSGRAGVRAQAVSPEGSLVDDFLITSESRSVHVLNAPSPAATSALQIGKSVTQELDKLLAN